MCLAVPALIESVEGLSGVANLGGISRTISLWLTPEVQPGDYVLIHAGYAINALSREDAEATLASFEELARIREEVC